MNIESSKINCGNTTKTTNKTTSNTDSSVKFSDELKELKESKEVKESTNIEKTTNIEETKETQNSTNKENQDLDSAIKGLNSVVKELNQSDEKISNSLKDTLSNADNNKKGNILINNDFNISENKDLLPQMNPNMNMNFSGDGQPFSSFMQNNTTPDSNNRIGSSTKDLAEEAAILSTMAENIALANKNNSLKDSAVISNEEGIKKVDKQTGITIEHIVKYDSVIMNEADVEVFVELIQKGEVNINTVSPQALEKSISVSKTLTDLLAKSMETNQPVRIDFDNNISVIIRISRDGKITADFLPSSQVAEAYLKENLPLLKQRFEEQGIEYDSLNQRQSKGKEQNNRKKGRNDE